MIPESFLILSLIGLALVPGVLHLPNETRSDVQSDEVVVFFPTSAHLDRIRSLGVCKVTYLLGISDVPGPEHD